MFEDYDLAELVARIDWPPFFQAWELAGNYPDILDDPVVGETARNLFDDAQAMLQRIVGEKWLTARGVIGLWPANRIGDDDIEIFTDDTRSGVRADRPLPCASRWTAGATTAPTSRSPISSRRRRRGVADYIGAFAVTAGIGVDAIATRVRGRPRRLQRDPAQGAGRPPGRGLRRTPARARAHASSGAMPPARPSPTRT